MVIAEFIYEAKIVVLVDGSPHHRDYVQEDGRRKRVRLKGLGCRVTAVKTEEPEAGLDHLDLLEPALARPTFARFSRE